MDQSTQLPKTPLRRVGPQQDGIESGPRHFRLTGHNVRERYVAAQYDWILVNKSIRENALMSSRDYFRAWRPLPQIAPAADISPEEDIAALRTAIGGPTIGRTLMGNACDT